MPAFAEWRKNTSSDTGDIDLVMKSSGDNGKTWSISTVLHPGPAAYSDLTILTSGELGCLYEAGKITPYEVIVFELVSIEETVK